MARRIFTLKMIKGIANFLILLSVKKNKGLSKEKKICEIFSSLLKGKKAIGYISQINKIFNRFEKTYLLWIWYDISIKMNFIGCLKGPKKIIKIIYLVSLNIITSYKRLIFSEMMSLGNIWLFVETEWPQKSRPIFYIYRKKNKFVNYIIYSKE